MCRNIRCNVFFVYEIYGTGRSLVPCVGYEAGQKLKGQVGRWRHMMSPKVDGGGSSSRGNFFPATSLIYDQ